MFAENFQKLCNKRGVSVTKVAQDIGIAPTTAYDWIKTDAKPRQATIKKVADYFGVDPSYFEQEELKLIPVHVITTEEQQILMMLNTLTEERKTLVLELIKELSR